MEKNEIILRPSKIFILISVFTIAGVSFLSVVGFVAYYKCESLAKSLTYLIMGILLFAFGVIGQSEAISNVVRIDFKGILDYDKVLWLFERKNLIKWDEIQKIYAGKYVEGREYSAGCVHPRFVIRTDDGRLKERSFSWTGYEGDWEQVIKIIHENLPESAIGDPSELASKPRSIIE